MSTCEGDWGQGALTITGQWGPLTRVEEGLTSPQVLFTLSHQQRVAHMTVMKVLEQQPLGEEEASLRACKCSLLNWWWWMVKGETKTREIRGSLGSISKGSRLRFLLNGLYSGMPNLGLQQ